jgi:threonine aldolase
MVVESGMPPRTPAHRQFASDNYAGIAPEALVAMQEANVGHTPGYGDDRWTSEAADLLRALFETDCDVYFVFNGTAANSLALAAMTRSYHSVLCHETSHVETDECGAPEFFSNGTKVLTMPGPDGKVTPSGIRHLVEKRSDIHYPKPRVVSVTQCTEQGSVYSLDELRGIGAAARTHGLAFHMDGARLANAVAALGCHPADVTWRAGVDVLCFGGTKNGMAVGEAVVFFDRTRSEEFAYRCKQAGQLASKMRFLAAPWVGMLRSGAWLARAAHANAMAARLFGRVGALPGVRIARPPQANSLFLHLPPGVADALRARGWRFYDFSAGAGSRLMCAWDTTPEDVDALADDLAAVIAGRPSLPS